MSIIKLENQIKEKKSFLCIGLDIDLNKIPNHLMEEEDPIFSFAKDIIDSTNKYAVAYKPNIAFFEAYGLSGWKSLEKIINYINSNYPEIFTIADAKRGDIGNTSNMYAKAFFENLEFDSITISPYMGKDSVEPFLSFDNKYVFLLTLTSNSGSEDFQLKQISNTSNKLYEDVILTSKEWKNSQNIMYVVGAKNVKEIARIRKLVPNSYLLIPGVGAQGGSLMDICDNGLDSGLKLLVNSSRSIIYSSNAKDYAEKAMLASSKIQEEMERYIIEKGII
tara:strand:+ start:1853 stop:2686 length:834 start_codon:yes stop_codon:yes gene_type:complete